MIGTKACPSCGIELAQVKTAHGLHFSCPQCSGLLIGVAVLQKLREAQAVQRLWVDARKESRAGSRPCPECRASMLVVSTPPGHGGIELDVCPRCYVVWLDSGELEKLPQKPEVETRSEQREEDRREKRARDDKRRKEEDLRRHTRPHRAEDGTLLDVLADLIFWWD